MLEKNLAVLKRELLYYFLILLGLSLMFHSDLLSNPSARFDLMLDKENYFHPLIYSFVVYSSLLIIRKIIDFILGLFQK